MSRKGSDGTCGGFGGVVRVVQFSGGLEGLPNFFEFIYAVGIEARGISYLRCLKSEFHRRVVELTSALVAMAKERGSSWSTLLFLSPSG